MSDIENPIADLWEIAFQHGMDPYDAVEEYVDDPTPMPDELRAAVVAALGTDTPTEADITYLITEMHDRAGDNE